MNGAFSFIVFSFILSSVLCVDFVYETASLLRDNEGYVAAFGDFNADKFYDIFVITNDSQRVDVLLAQTDGPFQRKNLITVNGSVITSVVPADFDGDVQMDLLVTTRLIGNTDSPLTLLVFWGDQAKVTVSGPYRISETYSDEPFVFDYNADIRPDLLVETGQQNRTVWLASPSRNFTAVPFIQHGEDLSAAFFQPQSHAFADLNGDYISDVFLTTEEGFEVWYNEDGVFRWNKTYGFPSDLKYHGQSAFIDLDRDTKLDHILPGCLDDDCQQSTIMAYINEQWLHLTEDHFIIHDEPWGFVPPGKGEFAENTNQTFPVTLHFGDYDMDGYPDAIAILRHADERQMAVLFANVPCSTPDECSRASRAFHIKDSEALSDINRGLVIAAFFDLYEDGIMDVILTTFSFGANTSNKDVQPNLVLLRNDIMADACFIKVTVVSGLCYGDCPGDRNPYGVNYPGPAVCYDTANTDGTKQHSCAGQLMQSSHYALQLPYVIFGLGQTPNFIDHLGTGLPQPKESEIKRFKEWPSIIPNSQLLVIPHPVDRPDSWLMKLYVAPSHLVYMTAVALLGTCGVVAIIVGILHWREKREDMLEKKQEAQKFHFDAM